MAISRYEFTKQIDGIRYGTNDINSKIFKAIESGAIQYQTFVLEEGQRLDHFAGNFYGTSSLWWVIAAASGIGWGLQVPPGTILRIPKDINQVYQIIT